MERKPIGVAPMLAILALFMAMLLAYWAAYCYYPLQQLYVGPTGDATRHYDSFWPAAAFWPAAKVDGLLTGRQVDTALP